MKEGGGVDYTSGKNTFKKPSLFKVSYLHFVLSEGIKNIYLFVMQYLSLYTS